MRSLALKLTLAFLIVGLAGTVLLRGTACSEQEDEQGCQGQRNNIRFQDQPLLG
mgnify:CR=1 FL=1